MPTDREAVFLFTVSAYAQDIIYEWLATEKTYFGGRFFNATRPGGTPLKSDGGARRTF